MTIEPKEQQLEHQPHAALLYEHMFPGFTWKELKLFNPINIPTVAKRVMWDWTLLWQLAEDSKLKQQSFATRVDILHPDQISYAIEFISGGIPTKNKAREGPVQDLLKPGERLGGIVLNNLHYMKPEAMDGTITNFVSTVLKEKSEDEEVPIQMIGVINQSGKPAGIIYYHEDNIPRVLKERNTQPAMLQKNPLPAIVTT